MQWYRKNEKKETKRKVQWNREHKEIHYARTSNNRHQRRATKKETDITAEWLVWLKNITTYCPLTETKMTNVAGKDNSKQLDHIVPLSLGGKHTKSNVRFISRKANLTRPNDASDIWIHRNQIWSNL